MTHLYLSPSPAPRTDVPVLCGVTIEKPWPFLPWEGDLRSVRTEELLPAIGGCSKCRKRFETANKAGVQFLAVIKPAVEAEGLSA